MNLFEQVWNDEKKLQDVTDIVIKNISTAYKENSPDFIYFYTLYNIFNEFLENISEDVLPNEATGFKQSKIWNMLYNFQKDVVLAIINKLERYNGCILADSVGLGKTFTALAVIKYYENRNKSVLVLCPKKLSENWNTYKGNYVNNPIAEDRLRYDVLYHTDLSRDHGKSNGIDLDSYYHTEWMPEEELQLKMEGLNMDAVYENFVRQIAGNDLQRNKAESLKVSVEKSEQKKQLKKQIIILQAKIRKEKQLNRQMEYNIRLKQLRKEMESYEVEE